MQTDDAIKDSEKTRAAFSLQIHELKSKRARKKPACRIITCMLVLVHRVISHRGYIHSDELCDLKLTDSPGTVAFAPMYIYKSSLYQIAIRYNNVMILYSTGYWAHCRIIGSIFSAADG